MVGYYRATEYIREHLKADRNINTVVIGGLDKVDLSKQTIFPLAQIVVNSSSTKGGWTGINMTVACMDIVKTNQAYDFIGEDWKLIDNNQDILNTQQAVFESLEKSLIHGTLSDLSLKLEDNFDLDAFEYRFENILTGWECTFDVLIPNTIQSCGSSYTLGDITFSNTLITFSNDNG